MLIDGEAMTYTSKNNATREFFGVTAPAKGTHSAEHNPGATIYWIQYDVWLLYGNLSVGAPVVNGDLEPAFDLELSTNWVWDYKDFAAGFLPSDLNSYPLYWSQRWTPYQYRAPFHPYGGDENSFPSLIKYCPWEVLGLSTTAQGDYRYPVPGEGRFYLYNPCGILEANFIDGKKCKENANATWAAEIQSGADGAGWTWEYTIAAPVTPGVGVWEAWSRDEVLTAGATYVALFLLGGWWNGTTQWADYLQADECVVTLNDANTPTIALGNEQATYSLVCRITNNDTGEAIDLTMTMETNETLEVDTDAKNVVYLKDNGVQLQALTFAGGVRRTWLRLAPGAERAAIRRSGHGWDHDHDNVAEEILLVSVARALVFSQLGAQMAEVEPDLSSVVWQLNGFGQAKFTLAWSDSKVHAINPAVRQPDADPVRQRVAGLGRRD